MAIEKYQLKNGKDRWKVRVYAGKNPQTGQEIRIKRPGFTTYREAKLEESRILASYDIEKHLEESNTAYKFEEVTDLWLSQYKNTVKENTFKSAQELIERKITPVFGNYYIDKIPLRLCQNSVNEWYKTYTRSSLIVSYFNRIVDFAISLGYCTDNPMKRTIRPKNTHRKEYDAPFYLKDELQLLFEKTLESEDYI